VRYKAVIFDLDGTLVDSLDDLADSMNFALAQAGLPQHPVESYQKMIGNGVQNLVKRSLSPEKQESFAEVLRLMKENYTNNALNKTKVYDGLYQVVQTLRKGGLQQAVLTNKDQTFAVNIVKHYFGPDLFELVWGAMSGRPIKPDPAALVQLLEEIKVSPKDAVFVGDSGVDMDVAKAAGVASVGVTWGFRDRKELLEHQAGTIIDKPQELLKILAW
jgi:phosphoglycolate phosphatase